MNSYIPMKWDTQEKWNNSQKYERLNQEEIENLNKPITGNEIIPVIKNFLMK